MELFPQTVPATLSTPPRTRRLEPVISPLIQKKLHKGSSLCLILGQTLTPRSILSATFMHNTKNVRNRYRFSLILLHPNCFRKSEMVHPQNRSALTAEPATSSAATSTGATISSANFRTMM
eukprot:IDg14039t1